MAAALFSFRAAALAALLVAVMAACGARGQLQPSNASADSQERSLLSYSGGWIPAKATWYGAPTGAGPDDNGGACGFKHTNQYPFSSMTSCGNEPIFKDGKGCGSCYQIRCVKSNHPACSGVPQTVVITDMNYYPVAKYHFDLSGTAFGSMATYGLNDKLRHAGIIDPNRPLKGPYSLRITNESGKQLVAKNIIPDNYIPNTNYRSYVQY
ncbi:hypothetical protein PVAP13_9KG327100 [Panicum virgatum]|uniref:Expansin-like EG45 domain-containing protein n=1 Tax=Panicum virgatum TaxID=38727 RepID=A0A8T0NP37_PANVG|nr:hypothetical protein PVAP13_9KG327100 [Panicum virgatum]